MEDLRRNLVNSPYLFGNKFMQEKDFGALACWHELMFNRTHLERGHYRLDKDVYLEMPQVYRVHNIEIFKLVGAFQPRTQKRP